MNEVGCFGKVPAHGDFVWQALPADFVTPWDNWIQAQLLALREARGDGWLDGYLCSSIWRFVVRDDAFGASSWAGIVAPSVDMVGRYFPFTIAAGLPRYASVVTAPAILDDWFAHLEDCLLRALQDALPVESVLASARAFTPPDIGERSAEQEQAAQTPWSLACGLDSSWTAGMLDNIVHLQFPRPCRWAAVHPESNRQQIEISDGVEGFARLFTSLP